MSNFVKHHTEILGLEEKAAISKSKALQLKNELSGVNDELVSIRKDFTTQRFSFEQYMYAETSRLQGRIDTLEK